MLGGIGITHFSFVALRLTSLSKDGNARELDIIEWAVTNVIVSGVCFKQDRKEFEVLLCAKLLK